MKIIQLKCLKKKSIVYCGKSFIVSVLLVCLIISCSGEIKEAKEQVEKTAYVPEKDKVDVVELQRSSFKKELISNGKLVATQKSKLKFNINGSLHKIFVKNGDYVKKNKSLASLLDFKHKQALAKAELSLKKSELELEDMLVSRGYDIQEKDDIPSATYEMASIRSGYQEAKMQIENARFELNSTTLKAPFSGKVADVHYKISEQVASGSDFLTLIDDAAFEVEFYIIESEINKVHKNESIEILAFSSGKEYDGKITSINPVVEKNGTVQVKAKVMNEDGLLLEGMNVKVSLAEDIPNQLVVPKSAVVLRQNQEVLFKYVGGKTYWTYIKIIHENSTSYAIEADSERATANLNEKDTVIVSGNLNLAHGIDVMINRYITE